MRKQEDHEFIALLNKIRVGIVDEEVERLLRSRFVTKGSQSYPKHALHMFAENHPVVDYNELMLNQVDGKIVLIIAIDEVPHEVQLSDNQIDAIRTRKIGEMGNLEGILKIKIGAQVMLTSNVNIEDRLVNGLVGTVMKVQYDNENVKVIYICFNDQNAGLATMRSDIIGRKASLDTSSEI